MARAAEAMSGAGEEAELQLSPARRLSFLSSASFRSAASYNSFRSCRSIKSFGSRASFRSVVSRELGSSYYSCGDHEPSIRAGLVNSGYRGSQQEDR